MNINRPLLYQSIQTFIVAVAVTPTPILSSANRTDLIDSFVISLDATAANNIFFGDQGVTILTGIEIVAGGGPVNFVIRNQPQQYDLQTPALAIAETLQCQPTQGFAIPFTVWDLSQVFLIAAAPTSVRVAVFRSQFI